MLRDDRTTRSETGIGGHDTMSRCHITILVILSVSLIIPSTFAAPPPAPTAAHTQDIYYDTDGLIVHHGPNGELDGGDTAQREGWYWLGVWIRQNVPGLQPWPPPRKLTFD